VIGSQLFEEKEMKVLNTVNNGSFCQETYETASRDAGKRAKVLRQLGYQVSVSSIGSQISPLGVVKMTMVDVRPGNHADTFGLPEVEKFSWPRN
jgi:hypothetical protein